MGYADKLKLNSSKIQTDEKVLEEKNFKKKAMGRPKKTENEVRNVAIPVASFYEKSGTYINSDGIKQKVISKMNKNKNPHQRLHIGYI